MLNRTPKSRSNWRKVPQASCLWFYSSWKLEVLWIFANCIDIVFNDTPKSRSQESKWAWDVFKMGLVVCRPYRTGVLNLPSQREGATPEQVSNMGVRRVQNGSCCSAVRIGRGFKSSLSERGRYNGTFCTWMSPATAGCRMVVKVERRYAEWDSNYSESGVQNERGVVPSVSDGDVQNKRGMCPKWTRCCLKTC